MGGDVGGCWLMGLVVISVISVDGCEEGVDDACVCFIIGGHRI